MIFAGKGLIRPYGQKQVMANWDPQLETVVFHDQQDKPIVSSTAFAFVYPAFFGQSISGNIKQ